jgi:hypothetical protein
MPRTKHAVVALPTAQPQAIVADLAAVKALHAGTATPEQQRRALDWIMKRAAGIGEVSFHPGDSHATAFKDGRRFVGLILANVLAKTMDALRREYGLPARDPTNSAPPQE